MKEARVAEDIKLIKAGKMISTAEEEQIIRDYENTVKAKLLRGVSFFEVGPFEGYNYVSNAKSFPLG